MDYYKDSMRNFIESLTEDIQENTQENIIEEDIEENVQTKDIQELIEELETTCEKWESFRQTTSNNDYNEGYETGLMHASEKIKNILESFKGDAIV